MSALVALYLERECAGGEFVSTDAEIATANGVSLSTVTRAVTRATNNGWLQVERHKRRKSVYRWKLTRKLDASSGELTRHHDTSSDASSPLPTRAHTLSSYSSTPKKEERKEKTRASERKPVLTLVAADWFPDKAGVEYAKARNVQQSEVERFIDYHRKKGSVFADWHAAWRTWCRNQVTFHERDQQKRRVAESIAL